MKTLGLNDELTDLTTHVTADSTVTLAVVGNVGLVSILPGQAFSACSQARTVWVTSAKGVVARMIIGCHDILDTIAITYCEPWRAWSSWTWRT